MIDKHSAKDQNPSSIINYNTLSDDALVEDKAKDKEAEFMPFEGAESESPDAGKSLDVIHEKRYKRAATRAALIDATQSLIMEQGKEKITIQDITLCANVCSGTFYNYFESKHKVFEAIAEGMLADFIKELDSIRAPLTDPAMIVAVTINHCFERAQNHETWNRFLSVTCLSDKYFLHQDADQCYQDIERGVAAGRFKVENIPFTQSLILAMVQHTNREIRLGNLETQTIDDATRAILKMLGISDVIARALTQPARPPIAVPKRNQTETPPASAEDDNSPRMLQPISDKARIIS